MYKDFSLCSLSLRLLWDIWTDLFGQNCIKSGVLIAHLQQYKLTYHVLSVQFCSQWPDVVFIWGKENSVENVEMQ